MILNHMAYRSDIVYEPIKKLGQGAFGEVLLARVVETGELVAQKRIFVRKAAGGVPDNVLRELKSMQCISHPNVIQLRGVFAQVGLVANRCNSLFKTTHMLLQACKYPCLQGQSVVMVMEFCPSNLASLLRQHHARLPERFVKALLQQALRGLAACHSAGVLSNTFRKNSLLCPTYSIIMNTPSYG